LNLCGVRCGCPGEILNLADQGNLDRIHSFGNDRAIFNWAHATLLSRQVGDLVDILAILMDGLEAGIKAISTESILLSQVQELQANNSQIKDRIYDRFQDMSVSLRETFLSLSLVSSLSEEEDDRLSDLVDGFQKSVHKELGELSSNSDQMVALINELRTPPPELNSLMELPEGDSSDSGDSGIAFF
jgi:hypothetical protein